MTSPITSPTSLIVYTMYEEDSNGEIVKTITAICRNSLCIHTEDCDCNIDIDDLCEYTGPGLFANPQPKCCEDVIAVVHSIDLAAFN